MRIILFKILYKICKIPIVKIEKYKIKTENFVEV